MIFNRVWAMPNKWTFTIKTINKLIKKYVGSGMGWVDPFAGENSPAEITNDLNPASPTRRSSFRHHSYCREEIFGKSVLK